MTKKPLDLVLLSELARELGMHWKTLERRLCALEHTLGRRVIVQKGPNHRRYVDRAYLARLNGNNGKMLEHRLRKLEQDVTDLRSDLEQAVERLDRLLNEHGIC